MLDEKYPSSYARNNYMVTTYAKIAVDNYCKAKEKMEEILEQEWYEILADIRLIEKLEESAIITVIFATMSIEAFLNDYAAACLGDNDFYDNFDKLSVENKFNLISKFILKVQIDKSKAYYYFLRKLLKKRNELVHSKSEDANKYALTKEELDDLVEERERIGEDFYKKSAESLIKECMALLDHSKNAIKAMLELSRFFDKNDEVVRAERKMFFFAIDALTEETIIYKDFVKEFRLLRGGK